MCREVLVTLSFVRVLFTFNPRGTHGVFVWVHGERQLLEGLSDLSGRGLSADSQQTVVVLSVCIHHF